MSDAMATTQQARDAEAQLPETLESFQEFVGSGVVALKEGSRAMAVAIYVSKPEADLPKAFVRAIPRTIRAGRTAGGVEVPTKIVNVGTLALRA